MAISLADTYVQTLLDLEKSGATKDAAERFVAIVKRRGHARLLPQILAKYERAKTGETARGLQIRVASERVQLPPLPLGEGWGEGPGTKLTPIIDPSLVSGFSVQGRDFRIDSSGRRALLELYKKMTTV